MQSKKYFLKKAKRAKRRELKRFRIKIGKINYKCITNKTIVDVKKDLNEILKNNYFTISLEFLKDISTRDITPEEKEMYKKYNTDILERCKNAVLDSQSSIMTYIKNTSAPTEKDDPVSWNEKVGNPTDDLKEFVENSGFEGLNITRSMYDNIYLNDKEKQIKSFIFDSFRTSMLHQKKFEDIFFKALISCDINHIYP